MTLLQVLEAWIDGSAHSGTAFLARPLKTQKKAEQAAKTKIFFDHLLREGSNFQPPD
jgi:hypothetical protein